MADVLENILHLKRKALKIAKETASQEELEKQAKAVTNRGFLGSFLREADISVIAEMKRKSPSAGPIREPYEPGDIAAAFEKGGASAVSVLTETPSFGGDLMDLKKAREATVLPILRKDFVFDPYQVIEAKANGADAVLLIADMMAPGQLNELVQCADQYQIEPLVEVFTSDVLPVVLNSGARLLGVNARNLRTLQMSPENVFRISRMIPRDRHIVAESGIKTPEEMEKLKALRVSAALIGESILKQADLESAVRRFVAAAKRGPM